MFTKGPFDAPPTFHSSHGPAPARPRQATFSGFAPGDDTITAKSVDRMCEAGWGVRFHRIYQTRSRAGSFARIIHIYIYIILIQEPFQRLGPVSPPIFSHGKTISGPRQELTSCPSDARPGSRRARRCTSTMPPDWDSSLSRARVEGEWETIRDAKPMQTTT